MNQNYGFLICPDTQTVCDVHADPSDVQELRQMLRVRDADLLRQTIERTGDTIIMSEFLNGTTAGKPSRCEGFELYGERFYGPAAVFASDQTRKSPVLDPQDVCRVIRFFRLQHDASQAASHSFSSSSMAHT